MSWSRQGDGDDRDGRRGYHHGNLREALVRAALDLIAQKGPAGFTFADAARWAGVSSAAPYRHFRDRDALLADVARRGFELFETRCGEPGTTAGPTRTGLSRMPAGPTWYFARNEPAYYSAMFEAGVSLEPIPGCARRRVGPSRYCAMPRRRCAPGCRPRSARRR